MVSTEQLKMLQITPQGGIDYIGIVTTVLGTLLGATSVLMNRR